MNDCQRVLLEFVESLHSTTDPGDSFAALEKAVVQLGFEHISYTYVPELMNQALSDLAPVFMTSANYRNDFIEQYQASNFGQHDFTIKKITQGDVEPIVWWQVASNRQLSSKEQNIIEVARADYGLRHGITIPVYSEAGSIAGVSITSNEPDTLFEILYREKIHTVTLMAKLFNDRVLRQPQNRAMFFAPFLRAFSETEKKVLALLGQGHNLKSIASDLQLDYKYLANNVISGLRRKFGNVPRDRLLYQAGRIDFDKIIT